MIIESPSRERSRRVRQRRVLQLGALAIVLGAYPAFVLAATYMQFFSAHLPGGRNGPADAYRHSLASAIVAYTSSPRCVEWVTAVMERGGQGTSARAMDAHNNLLGARIGANARSWHEMQVAIHQAVQDGAVDATDPNRITWLPRTRWQNRLY